ncbi:MAG TPA: hypothetical protein VJX94_05085 [Stellaceae bacterium]|nr:hypothetical protein [Stellaceae bacterium]
MSFPLIGIVSTYGLGYVMAGIAVMLAIAAFAGRRSATRRGGWRSTRSRRSPSDLPTMRGRVSRAKHVGRLENPVSTTRTIESSA